MSSYKVLVEPIANQDLLGIVSYITNSLREPQTAKKIYSSLKGGILSLSDMPYRCKTVSDEPFYEIGMRRLEAENYSVFYFVAEETKTVHIVRILYNRREWKYLL